MKRTGGGEESTHSYYCWWSFFGRETELLLLHALSALFGFVVEEG